METRIEYSEMTEDQQHKATLLADYLGEGVGSVELEESCGDEVYHIEGDSYIIRTDDEADDAARADLRNFIDDAGIGDFTEDFRGYIMEACVDSDRFFSDMRSDQVDTILESPTSYSNFFDEFDVRHKASELFSSGTLSADVFLTMDDYEDTPEYFDGVDLDELLEVLKEADELDSFAGVAADQYLDQYLNAYEYLEEIYGEQDSESIMKSLQEYIDVDAIIDAAIDSDGRAHFISRYDGEEHDLGEDLYAYRES